MRKLSETLLRSSSQALVLFDDVLDGDKLLQSPEIKALVNHFYDSADLSVVKIDNPEKLHDYLREAQYKSNRLGRGMIYPVKARFEELALTTYSDQFSGPLYVNIFTPDEAVFDVLTITCCWDDGLFRNDYYVVGAIVEMDDFGALLKDRISEGKKASFSSSPWWTDCLNQVKIWIFQDRTTTKDNLYEKAMNYARNYLFSIPEFSSINKDTVVKEIADEIERDLKDACFDQRPPASVVAQKERNKIPEDPEKRFIRLCP